MCIVGSSFDAHNLKDIIRWRLSSQIDFQLANDVTHDDLYIGRIFDTMLQTGCTILRILRKVYKTKYARAIMKHDSDVCFDYAYLAGHMDVYRNLCRSFSGVDTDMFISLFPEGYEEHLDEIRCFGLNVNECSVTKYSK
jgi:hypothetical protein